MTKYSSGPNALIQMPQTSPPIYLFELLNQIFPRPTTTRRFRGCRRDEKRTLPAKSIYRSILGRAGDILADESIHSRIYPFMDQSVRWPIHFRAADQAGGEKLFIEKICRGCSRLPSSSFVDSTSVANVHNCMS